MSTLITTNANITNVNTGTIKDSTGNTTSMTIDSAGRVTMPTRPAFACHLETTVALNGTNGWSGTGGSTSLSSGSWNWQTTHGGYNVGSHWNATDNEFTAPIAGLYSFTWSIVMASAGNQVSFRIIQAGGTTTNRYAGGAFDDAGDAITSPTHTIQLLMAVNDTCNLQVGYSKTGSVEGDSGGFGRTWWSGYLIG